MKRTETTNLVIPRQRMNRPDLHRNRTIAASLVQRGQQDLGPPLEHPQPCPACRSPPLFPFPVQLSVHHDPPTKPAAASGNVCPIKRRPQVPASDQPRTAHLVLISAPDTCPTLPASTASSRGDERAARCKAADQVVAHLPGKVERTRDA